jgi:hypothetical protein
MDAAKYAEQWNRKFILEEDKTIQGQVRDKGVAITSPMPSLPPGDDQRVRGATPGQGRPDGGLHPSISSVAGTPGARAPPRSGWGRGLRGPRAAGRAVLR